MRQMIVNGCIGSVQRKTATSTYTIVQYLGSVLSVAMVITAIRRFSPNLPVQLTK
jgi:hypothetical protein